MVPGDSCLPDQSLLQKAAEARGVRRWCSDVFVQVKHLDLLPVDSGKARQRIEKLELGRARGRDQACFALCLDSLAQDRSRLVGSDFGHLALVIEAFDHHVNTLRNSGFDGGHLARVLFHCLCEPKAQLHRRTRTSSIEGRGGSLFLSARIKSTASS
jgi:hypothetical protein